MAKEKKSKHHRDRSRDRSRDSSSDDDDKRMDRRLSEERKRKKEQKKLEKERRKLKETPEERRQRRMEKKRLKEEKRKRINDEETLIPPELAYTNLNNPFNDTKLTETFIWGKKLEREGKAHLSVRQIQKEASKRIQKNLHEAAEFKKIRDAKMAAREDMDMMKRDANMKNMPTWDAKEREFQLDQVKERTRIRIEQGRAKAIDILTRYIRYNDERTDDKKKQEEFELEDPIQTIKNLCKSSDDLEDLEEDIKIYRTLESNDRNEVFWNDIITIISEELKKKDCQDRGAVHGSKR
ncbi:unnamed protein product [Caenorhabditis bovis]|uniref:Splicing factor cactin central domain-containing protein n=1 Tax=Caenorhabditis bovis TaxID=2654633 RepID=A0A8S1EUD2_9PELO|nr:unnamed protein product [Caenorhabditis bovis]